MLGFILRRLGILVPTFIGVSFLAFMFIRVLPGDPILLMAGERSIKPERYKALLEQYGFDRSVLEQYWIYLQQLLHGNLGVSFATKKPVLTEFFTLFPATLELSLCAMMLAVVLGVPAGVIAAVRRGSVVDHGVMATALVGYSMPIFWWALLLIMVFSGWLGVTPVSGRIDLVYYFKPVTGFMLIDSLISGQKGAFQSALSHLILPAIVLATIPLAVIARQTRSAMLEVLGEDYVRTARAKGLSPRRVVGLHALRNALIPVVTTIGLQVGVLLDRRYPHGDDLLLAGHRQVDGRFDLPARLPVGAGRPSSHCDDRRPGQSHRRRALRPHQPAHQARKVTGWRR